MTLRYRAASACSAVLLVLTACGAATDPSDDSSPDRDRPTSSDQVSDPEGGKNGSADVPDLRGKGLGSAIEQAETAGFDVSSYDATGRTRFVAAPRSWQVCFQRLEPGPEGEAGELSLGVVKLDEECPTEDLGAEPPKLGEDGQMPDFTGYSLTAATDALGRDASVQRVDATGEERNIVWENNWRICGQAPAPGTQWSGEPVTLEVVKYGESCP